MKRSILLAMAWLAASACENPAPAPPPPAPKAAPRAAPKSTVAAPEPPLPKAPAPVPQLMPLPKTPVTEASIKALCTTCHRWTPPESQSQRAWKELVPEMYRHREMQRRPEVAPPADPTLAWFLERSPAQPQIPDTGLAKTGPGKLKLRPHHIVPDKSLGWNPTVADLQLTRVEGRADPVVLITDMQHGAVMAWSPTAKPTFQALTRVSYAAHCESVDVDGDRRRDLLISDLGSFHGEDHELGKVWLMRNMAPAVYRPQAILDKVGRVADARAADLDGDGDQDVVVGVFGNYDTGQVLWLENVGQPRAPKFRAHPLDPRNGTTMVATTDLNGDGRLDIVALITQQHEVVAAYINEGPAPEGGPTRFRVETLYQAPHPAWGSSTFIIEDLDRDGDADVIVANGDSPYSLELNPDHGIRWLENKGRFPFEHHAIAEVFAVHRVLSADMDGDGDLDLVASAHLRKDLLPYEVDASQLVSLLWLEQRKGLKFRPHALETGATDHAALEVGDVDEDGDPDIVVGSYNMPRGGDGTPREHPITWFENLRKSR